ncbi:N-acetylneuraminate synthase [Fusobacterium pseudoperiodonticum]|uniref:N-acetylneuraminate synthase n=1 Tax=Fusobacterium pseudoperiodonticum TaxID=2663009 RepID=UPI0028D11E30|nr:N-acetylneuraminate synthase [Fusobacterium pseudoperiodonticum]
MEKLVIIGAGGYAKSVLDSLNKEKYEVVGFLDNKKKGHHLGVPIIASSLDEIKNSNEFVYFISIGDNKKRKFWYSEVKKRNLKVISIIDKSAIISKEVTYGPGLFVGKLAVINNDAHIGENVIINTKALVEHGVHIGNHSNVSTNTTINGDVHIGNECFIGSSSVINGQLMIGDSCTIGSGTVVIHNINYGSTVVGVPGRIIKEDDKMKQKVFIVAEIGCNHNGDPELARKMVEIAKECGVDAVKFQTFKADLLISKYAPKAEYQKKVTDSKESQLDMTRKLELPFEKFVELEKYARSLGLEVFSTPFDFESIDFLAGYQQKIWKIPSGEITNLPYLEKIAKLPIINKQIVISTGMSTIEEIEEALRVLTENGVNPLDITILHCNTEYPTPYEDVNLLSIPYLKEKFPEYKIGFSDHSPGYFDGVAAVTYGITFIEKHFTLNKEFEGPDHKASVLPEELKLLCEGIRIVEKSLGRYKKIVTNSERKNKIVARKSIIAKVKIEKGDIFTIENLTTKRPGNGISPMYWYDILGKTAERDFEVDELIEDSRFENQGNN